MKTIFYMTDRGTKMIVPNDRLKLLVIEKKLPLNGGFHYLHKGICQDLLELIGLVLLKVRSAPLSIVEEKCNTLVLLDVLLLL